MFQPQATPYVPFSYGVTSPALHDFSGFQPSAGLVVDSGGPTVFRDPIFSPVATTIHAGASLPFTNPDPRPYKMENNDLEAQEALARDFQPALEGPLVGEKKSSNAITEEYAKADPIYVAKTAALPQKYSHYRPILGDGNCGWRAVGFSYFETLIRLRKRSQLQGEVVRMVSLNNLLIKVGGFEGWLVEDMVDETITLLKNLAELVETSPQAAEALLLERFNDKGISDSIVYHLRLLASAWLQKEADKYSGFIADGNGVEGYRKTYIEPVNMEIEHLGMTLLIDVLLKPIGIHVEIVYLDRSEGSQVNVHLIQPEDERGVPTNPGGPIMHLLYRPSHYDILYRDPIQLPPSQPIPQSTNIQVNRAFTQQHMTQNAPITNYSVDLSLLSCIPGFSLAPQPLRINSFPSHFPSPAEQSYTPSIATSASPISPGASSITTVSSHGLPSSFPAQPAPVISAPIPSPQPNFPPQIQLPIHTHLPTPHRPSLPTEVPSPSSGNSFRPSKYEWAAAAAADWQEAPVVFQTSTFRNSHYNTAHYNNPNFQPEEWTPESEEPAPVVRKKSS